MFSIKLKVSEDRNSLPRRSKKSSLRTTTPSQSRQSSFSSSTSSLSRLRGNQNPSSLKSSFNSNKSGKSNKKVRIQTSYETGATFTGRFSWNASYIVWLFYGSIISVCTENTGFYVSVTHTVPHKSQYVITFVFVGQYLKVIRPWLAS